MCYLILYTRLFTKLNLFEILFYITFITTKVSRSTVLLNNKNWHENDNQFLHLNTSFTIISGNAYKFIVLKHNGKTQASKGVYTIHGKSFKGKRFHDSHSCSLNHEYYPINYSTVLYNLWICQLAIWVYKHTTQKFSHK